MPLNGQIPLYVRASVRILTLQSQLLLMAFAQLHNVDPVVRISSTKRMCCPSIAWGLVAEKMPSTFC